MSKTKNNKKTIDWILHYVILDDSKNQYIGDTHTHGLNKHGHRELCLVLNMGQEVGGSLLNNLSAAIAFEGKQLTEGIHNDMLQNGFNLEIISLPDDPVLYVILPDENNRFPSDEGCASPYNKQYEYAKIISKQNKDF